ncbi:MBL fold metallo-hydrolase [Aquibacillus kalidii]|uniref:MBL fold metallo-hydrolase n=1 Tax=Aquibacillus kalidii TaxID=2762597 RepID=UPI00164539C6|nr:MBL fold metallo-hydrolase [Aquibacillus kalidii]
MDKEIEQQEEILHTQHADPEEVLEDVAFYRTLAANVCMIGKPDGEWVLVDTSIGRYSTRIIAAVEKRFGHNPPKAIILTHGHFDHAGSAKDLAKHWDIPIYIHAEELAYVTGEKGYPPADPTVGGGLLSLISTVFPKEPVNLKGLVFTLPDDGQIPLLNDWKYVHTPGHTPGHICLYREKDKTLITGDAVVTEKPESSLAVFLPIQKIHGPPSYLTQDWDKAEQSVKKLAQLEPNLVISGHGLPMDGETLREQLDDLATNFYSKSIPKHRKN